LKVIKDNMIFDQKEIQTAMQSATIESFYDMRLHSELSFGSGKVTANIFDYEGNSNPYNGEIVFEYDGQTIATQVVNGIASIDFSAPVGTEHTIRTLNTDMRNGEVTFIV
jgi:hypothetical protein